MKVFRRALLSLCAAALAAEPSFGSNIRVDNNNHDESELNDALIDRKLTGFGRNRKLAAQAHHSHDMQFTHSHDHPEVPDIASENKGVGCDCSKDDIDELLAAQSNILLPTSIMYGIGSTLKILPGITGATPTTPFGDVENAISSCIEYGIEVLGKLKCGGCVDHTSGFDDTKTYDCCCDSDSIKDIIKDQLSSILLAVPLILIPYGGEDVFRGLLNGIKRTTTLAIEGIINDYDEVSVSTPTSPALPP